MQGFSPEAILIYYVLKQNLQKRYAIFNFELLSCKIHTTYFCYIIFISLFKVSSKDNPNN